MRFALLLVLFSASSFAQTKVDFSGTFLRTETRFRKQSEPAIPRVLDVRQTADEILVTAIQNRETAAAHYNLVDKKKAKAQARLKGKNLLVKTIGVAHVWPSSFGGSGSLSEVVEENWGLSPDGQQLIINRKVGGISEYADIYIRQPSLDVALSAAARADQKDCRGGKPLLALKSENEAVRRYDAGADLGMVLLQGITRCVTYDASISGDFFKNLERIRDQNGSHFVRRGQAVGAYSGDLVLEVVPHPYYCPGEAGIWMQTGTPAPERALDLRFMVRWSGTQEKDLGEVPAEFRYEPWRELSPAVVSYRMQVQAQDIPLTDDLEVTIFSKTGEQLACIKGHI